MFDEMLKHIEALPIPPLAAAEEFDTRKNDLIEYVNRQMLEQPDLDTLIGDNPRQMMYDNHTHHALFMANVFKLGNYALLVRIGPWVYRAYHNRGFSYDYFPRHLRFWIAGMQNLLSDTSCHSLRAVYDWLRDHHESMIRLAEDPSYTTLPANEVYRPGAGAFLSALLHGRHHECLRLATEVAVTSVDLEKLYLEVIQPVMYRVGALWEKGEISVAQEHLITGIVIRVMATVSQRFEFASQQKERVLVATTPNELHELGPRMIADLLELEGYDVTCLGANTPAEDLIAIAIKQQPRFLALSVTMPFNIDRLVEICRTVRATSELSRVRIMVGGQAFLGMPKLWQVAQADGCGPDARAAVNLANQWHREAASA